VTPESPVLKGWRKQLPEVVIAENQPQYLPLPALVSRHAAGMVTTRWRLTWRERLRVLLSGDIWLQMMCFQKPITPVKLLAEQPAVEDCL
jgi:hypothetical protein